jgi:hypothetical protein
MGERKPSATLPTEPALRKLHFVMCATFACAGLASWQGLVWSRHSDHHLVGLFAIVCLICLFGAVQSIALPLAFKHSKSSSHALRADPLNTARTDRGDYVATFSIGEKIKYLCLVAALALVAGFLIRHSTPWLMLLIIGALLTVNCILAYRVCFTTVRFSSQEISIRIVPFVHFSEPYSDITAIHAKIGVLKLRFAGGRSMSLWSNLGDSTKILSILMRNTDVLPGG